MNIFKKILNLKNINYIGVVKCPDCNGMNTKVNNLSNTYTGYFLISLMCFSFSMFLPILGWVLAPIFFIIGFASLIISIVGFISKDYSFTCRDCKAKNKISKSEFKRISNTPVKIK